MCGIFGFSGKNPVNIDKINILGMYNLSRGEDATGIIYRDKNHKDPEIAIQTFTKKKITPINKFLAEDMDLKVSNPNLFIGHTRKGTKGKNILQNAHPFSKTTLAGVHNGTLEDYYYLFNRLKNEAKNDKILGEKEIEKVFNIPTDASDSLLLYILFDVYGPQRLFELYSGAASIALTQYNHGNLVLYHDKNRTLYTGYIKDDLYFSSIENSLKAIGCDDVTYVPENEMFVYDDGRLIAHKSIDRKPLVPPSENKSFSGQACLPCAPTVKQLQSSFKNRNRSDQKTHVELKVPAIILDNNKEINIPIEIADIHSTDISYKNRKDLKGIEGIQFNFENNACCYFENTLLGWVTDNNIGAWLQLLWNKKEWNANIFRGYKNNSWESYSVNSSWAITMFNSLGYQITPKKDCYELKLEIKSKVIIPKEAVEILEENKLNSILSSKSYFNNSKGNILTEHYENNNQLLNILPIRSINLDNDGENPFKDEDEVTSSLLDVGDKFFYKASDSLFIPVQIAYISNTGTRLRCDIIGSNTNAKDFSKKSFLYVKDIENLYTIEEYYNFLSDNYDSCYSEIFEMMPVDAFSLFERVWMLELIIAGVPSRQFFDQLQDLTEDLTESNLQTLLPEIRHLIYRTEDYTRDKMLDVVNEIREKISDNIENSMIIG